MLYKEIQDTMTVSETVTFASIMTPLTPMHSIDLSEGNSILSDLTTQQMQHPQQSKVLQLNYSSGNSAMVLETYIAEKDLREARERNRIKKMEGDEMMKKFDDVKAVTAMYHFNEFGCSVGTDALKKKQLIQRINEKKQQDQLKKDQNEFEIKRFKYDQVVEQNIPDENLNGVQLKTLLALLKRKSDKISISKLNKVKLLELWME